MNRLRKPVSVPFWFLLFGAFSLVVALLNRILLPSVRWLFRTRANRVIQQANDRLSLRIPEFKLTPRKELIGRLVYDPDLIETVAEQSRETGTPRDVLMQHVERYANEIVPAFNAYVYFRYGIGLARAITNLFYRLRVEQLDAAAMQRLDTDSSSIVFVMNHRSNTDYLLLGLLASNHTTLSYAVGEWAKPFPLRHFIKGVGGFFVRRGSGNPLYRRVLERYVQMATRAGVVQVIFPEGRLTADGRLREPRIGLLDYMLRTFRTGEQRDLVLVPVAVNYDRTVEDRNMSRSADTREGKPSKWANLWNSVKFAGHNIPLLIAGTRYRFGQAVVNVGSPVSVSDWARQHGIEFADLPREERITQAQALAGALMEEIGRIIPVLPVSVVATVLVEAGSTWLTREALYARTRELLDRLEAQGARIYIPRDTERQALDGALDSLALRRLVEVEGPLTEGALCRANPAELPLLRYYANSIAHL
jgi:glycerol-3-phosphate O-acyltransferase